MANGSGRQVTATGNNNGRAALAAIMFLAGVAITPVGGVVGVHHQVLGTAMMLIGITVFGVGILMFWQSEISTRFPWERGARPVPVRVQSHTDRPVK